MKKELIILAFYINADNLTRKNILNFTNEYKELLFNIFNDEELKENYIIKYFIIPSNLTKIECIYPKDTLGNNSIEVESQIKKLEIEILKRKDSKLWDEWNILMRKIKLEKLNQINEKL